MRKEIIILTLLLSACSSGGQLADAPDWYTEPPTESGKVYASGYASDKNLQFAIDVSEMSAKRTLASHLSTNVNGRSKYYRGANGKNLSEIASVETIDNVNLSGFERKEIEVVEEENSFRVYILLAYRLDNMSEEPKIFDEIKP
tara:strand:- start:544 stop:975 length:432 start_codon:yes stop_codon:yes gene_type:complete